MIRMVRISITVVLISNREKILTRPFCGVHIIDILSSYLTKELPKESVWVIIGRRSANSKHTRSRGWVGCPKLTKFSLPLAGTEIRLRSAQSPDHEVGPSSSGLGNSCWRKGSYSSSWLLRDIKFSLVCSTSIVLSSFLYPTYLQQISEPNLTSSSLGNKLTSQEA